TRTGVAGPPGVSSPSATQTVSQEDAWPIDQVRGAPPELVNISVRAPGLKGPTTGPSALKPAPGEMESASGRSNDSCTPVVVELGGEVALAPIPRFANAAHNSLRFAPP